MAAKKSSAGVEAADTSSLKRLKDLSDLPNLDSQLQEARTLCNHPAQADMILKWLLEQMKTSLETRSDVRSWELLASTSRLLSAAKLATLLGSVNLLKLVEDSFAGSKDHRRELLKVIAQTLDLLFNLAASGKGAPLQAYLSSDTSEAAAFVTAWLVESRRATNFDHLKPALQIWYLRKRSSGENEAFATYCLGSVGEVISVLGHINERSFCMDDAFSKKRKRPGSDAVTSQLQEFESLLAKHVFLPARTAFFNAQETRHGSKKPANEPEAMNLAERLASLQSLTSTDSLARLLDIALRCSPAMTPRQRLKEESWVEALFSALIDAAPDDVPTSCQFRVQMMVVVVRQRQVPLSTGFLQRLVAARGKYDEKSGGEPRQRIDWKLVEEVVKLDAKVYTMTEAARALFDDISESSLACAEDRDCKDEGAQEDRKGLFNAWKNSIIIPIMQAFARNRDILTFVELWEQQLVRSWPDVIIPVWFELQHAFSELVEEHLTEQKINNLMDQHATVLMARSRDAGFEDVGAALSRITASATILDAVLGGIRTPELLDSIWPQIDQLFRGVLLASKQHSIVKIAEANDDKPCPQIWTLLERLLELWFPLWAAEYAASDSIDEWVSSSNLIVPVEQSIKTMHGGKGASMLARYAAARAESWLLTFCSVTSQCTNRGKDRTLYDRIAPKMSVGHLVAFLRHPQTFEILGEDVGNDLILKWLCDTARPQIELGQVEPVISRIRGVIDAAVAGCRPDVIDGIVRTALAMLPSQKQSRNGNPGNIMSNVASSKLWLNIVLELPPTALSVPQRERIIDAAASLQYSQYQGEEVLECRLLVMNKFLELPSPSAKILTDSTPLWRLACPHYQGGDFGVWHKYHASHKVQELLKRLTELVMRQLLAAQTQDKSAAMITALYEVAFSIMHQVPSYVEGEFAPRLLYIISPLLSSMRRLRNELSARCIDQAALRTYTDRLLGKSRQSMKADNFKSDFSAQIELKVVLDALLHIPSAMLPAETIKDLNTLAVRTVAALQNPIAEEEQRIADARKFLLVRCLKVLCLKGLDYGTNMLQEVAQLAISLLDQGLGPQDHVTVFESLDKALISSTARSRLQLVQHFLQASHSLQAIRLLRTTLSSLNREDFDESPASKADSAQTIFADVLAIAKKADNPALTRAACDCITTILREKPFVINQYTIEATLGALKHLTDNSPRLNLLYPDFCRILTALLQQHRSRLSDRMNILVDLLQTLLTPFFTTKKSSTSPKRGILTPRHAKLLSRILQLLCNPPAHLTRTKTSRSELVDEARKAQAHVGRYMQYVLHHFCTQVLAGRLGEGVREALMPGLWAIVEAMEVSEGEGVKCLSAAMGNSERAVLRGVVEEWRAVGRWSGG
ncbi:Urb2/Npa2 family [Teratosphaeria destructans]|uniref:Urb2/Npa2 family n=1 Tax=Teratosphaeria destructans TaxID=418781 RepID=A0A9W7W1B3_9PEZI|nr:Urb2/Npa2 family [Teratosphaeria destructans]